MRNGRDEYWDVVRGMAIVIVVFAHAIQAALHGVSDNPLHLVFQSFQMELMFFISGWCAAYSLGRSLAANLLGKSNRLLLPYFVWATIYFLLCAACGGARPSFAGLLSEYRVSAFWFLRILFLVTMVHLPLTLMQKLRHYPIYHAVGVVFLVAAMRLGRVDSCGGCGGLSHSVIWFELGFMAALFKGKVPIWAVRIVVLVGSVAFLLIHLFGIKVPGCALLGICAALFCSYLVGMTRGKSALVYCGRKSLAIYSIHWVFLFSVVSLRLVDFSCLLTYIPVYALAFVLFAGWMGLVVLIIIGIERSPAWMRMLLLGEKK